MSQTDTPSPARTEADRGPAGQALEPESDPPSIPEENNPDIEEAEKQRS